MPIGEALNDTPCLEGLHESAREFSTTPTAQRLAELLEIPENVEDHLRSLDQRDDFGDPNDGPRLACEVSQRLRLPALDPNCFERTAMYLALVSLLDPERELTSATLMFDEGLHTFPVEIVDGVPRAVVLDPETQGLANAMNATACQLRNASPMRKERIGAWFCGLAWNACAAHGHEDCYDSAMNAIRNSLLTGEPITHPDDVDCVLTLARTDAALYGPSGRAAYNRVARSVRNLGRLLENGKVYDTLTKIMNNPTTQQAIKLALVAEFGPVAQVALDGLDLGVQKAEKAEKAEKAGKEPSQALLPLHLTTGASDEDEDDEDDDEPVTRAERHARMRRMTLGFRQLSR